MWPVEGAFPTLTFHKPIAVAAENEPVYEALFGTAPPLAHDARPVASEYAVASLNVTPLTPTPAEELA